jgi:hypothetical protein
LRAQLKHLMLANQEKTGRASKTGSPEQVRQLEDKLRDLEDSRRVSEQALQEQIFFLRRTNDSMVESMKVQADRFEGVFRELREDSRSK